MMKTFKKEIQDGLQSSIENGTCVAYESKMNIGKAHNLSVLDNVEHPNIVTAKTNDDWDLFYFNSILVSVGWNKNDDVFDSKETFLAKSSPVLKKVNYQHDEKDIIGVITASLILDKDGKTLQDNTLPPSDFDIAVSAALYKQWEDPALQERMDGIIEDVVKGEWFVSMECLFRNFDYALIDEDGNESILERNAATAFLTKYLRVFGGSGSYNNYKIGRLLRDFTFSGKGIVKNPANEKSIIFNTKAFHGETITEIKMPEDKLNALQLSLTKAEAKAEKLEDELKSKVEAAQVEAQAKLQKDIEKHKLTIADLETEKAEATKAFDAKEVELADSVKANKEVEVKLAEAQKALDTIKAEKVLSDRVSELVSAGVSKEEADKIADKWSGASDEQFADIVELNVALFEKKDDKKDDKKGKDKKDKKEDKVDADVSKAELEDDVELNLDDSDDESEVLYESAVAFLSDTLK